MINGDKQRPGRLTHRANKNDKIEENKVYTATYNLANKHLPNRRLIGVSIREPDYFKGELARELNPTEQLFFSYKGGNINDKEFEDWYIKTVLGKLNPIEIYQKYKGKVLCCWEESTEFCHRHIILKWLMDCLGEDILGGEIT